MTGKSRSVFIKEAVPTEAVLCDYFIEEANQVEGWVCYPETGGFDVLLVHESGRQIGVEAKLQLNAKVAEQILPHHSCYATGNPGPDHRVVIVRNTTDANAGIARMLDLLGVDVWEPWIGETFKRGHWLETDRIPPLDQQLPELYELAVQTLAAQPQKTDA